MKDADFAQLLTALVPQGRLKQLTYMNNEFKEKSLWALAEILGNSERNQTYQSRNFQHLESLRLGNLKNGSQPCSGKLIYELMLKVDDECMRNPLKCLKLQGVDLRYEIPDSGTIECISGQFRLNRGLLELDISHCVILPR